MTFNWNKISNFVYSCLNPNNKVMKEEIHFQENMKSGKKQAF